MEQLSTIKTTLGARLVNQNDDPYAVIDSAAGSGRTIHVSSTEPSSPTNGDIWIQIP